MPRVMAYSWKENYTAWRDTLVDRFLPPRVFVVSRWPRLFHRVLIELSSRHLSARAVCSCSRMQRGRPVKGNATTPMENTVFSRITFLDTIVNWHNWINKNWVVRYFILVFCGKFNYTKYGIWRVKKRFWEKRKIESLIEWNGLNGIAINVNIFSKKESSSFKDRGIQWRYTACPLFTL